ncbi:MAG: DciA family protein [Geminicoccaceae bacterium]|nr:DciA family protein [Geminicoccaceae bacterium]MDW8369616.1 DciA family protein [Geminicoccaceae bacterium]
MQGPTESLAGEERRRAPVRAALLVAALLPPAARRRSLAAASILDAWPTIVGPELAARCTPLALRFPQAGRGGGVLELAARAGAALELQHALPQLVERINGHLGWRAVARILLRQRVPTNPPPATATPRPTDPVVRAAIEADLASLADGDLRTALARLGGRLLEARAAPRGRRP